VLAPTEIWVIDFKTDAVVEAELSAKTREYAPQLRLYAEALQRIYDRPVTEMWLYFLKLRRAVRVEANT